MKDMNFEKIGAATKAFEESLVIVPNGEMWPHMVKEAPPAWVAPCIAGCKFSGHCTEHLTRTNYRRDYEAWKKGLYA